MQKAGQYRLARTNIMTKKRSNKKYRGYTATEDDLIRYAEYVLVGAFVWFTGAAIITGDAKQLGYSVITGLILGYGVFRKWFNI